MQELDCINVIVSGQEQQAAVSERISRIPGLYITSSSPNLVEIANAEAGKGAALKWLAEEYMGLSRTEVLAFGNADNDLDMILYAGKGLAVSNSPCHVLEQADQVIGDNKEDAVARYLEQCFL